MSVTRKLTKTFQELRQRGGKAFIPFITAGDPDLETTIRIVSELEGAGSDIVELGIPFSDPVADGPTIQRSSERALRHGYRLSDYLETVRILRGRSEIPIVLFSYFNPLLQYGLETLARDAVQAGVDGILITDVTPEEGEEYCAIMERHRLDPIFLVAPTSPADRIARIVACCRGFVYLVSRAGVTGAQASLSDSILSTFERVRAQTGLPIAVGFGISSPEQVRAVWQVADGAVVGSAIVAQIEAQAGAPDLPARIGSFCRWLRALTP
jgi:tryptophan synthase alpha chain